jgi:chromosomal replication initiator protein
MDISANSLWGKIVDNIKASVTPEIYNLWISPLKPLAFENNIFTVEVPNIYFLRWIENNQQKNIEKTLSDSCGGRVVLELKPQQNASFDAMEKVKDGTFNMEALTTRKDQINPKYTFSGFVVGASNRFAHSCSEAVAKKPAEQFNPFFIYSGVGLGKTHLLYAIGNYIKQSAPELKVRYVTCEKFVTEFIESIRFDKSAAFKNKYRNLDCLMIDDIQFLIGKESSQEEFFHMFNNLFNSKKQIVISSDRPPKDLESVKERLISRFEWGVIADIQPPDLETRIAILRKKVEEEKAYVPDDVILYIASQIKANIRQLEGAVLRVTMSSKFMGVPLTVDFAQNILKDIVKQSDSIDTTIETTKSCR